ncbi:MAG: ABC transporter permease [Spirochaetales bacterium]|jgi:NitT/TauT family transport system permease protein|nr:ABC transporter permease [Spirochaetales bacterium]
MKKMGAYFCSWRAGAFRKTRLNPAAFLARYRNFFSGVPLIFFFCLLWEILPRIGVLNPIFFPPFSEVLLALGALIHSGTLLKHIGSSLFRAMAGFLLAVLAAGPLGFLMGYSRKFERAADLLVQTLRNVSQFALLPVFIMLFGIGEISKIGLTFYASVWHMLINTISGVKNVDPMLIRAAVSMRTSKKDLFWKIIMPASFPSVVAGMRLGGRSAMMAVIGAEMIAAKSGVGYFVQYSQLIYHFPDMYAGIIVLCFLGLVLNYFLVWIERRATSWKIQNEEIKN